jgi:hypothetical protein
MSRAEPQFFAKWNPAFKQQEEEQSDDVSNG